VEHIMLLAWELAVQRGLQERKSAAATVVTVARRRTRKVEIVGAAFWEEIEPAGQRGVRYLGHPLIIPLTASEAVARWIVVAVREAHRWCPVKHQD
jgi:hypothetical protein